MNREAVATLAALNRSAATIEFAMDGTILTANASFLALLGYELSEVQGQHHRMFVDPDYGTSAQYAAFWKALAQGEHQTAEYKRFGKDGRELWIQASYNPVLGRDGRPFKIVKHATDVSQSRLDQADTAGQIAAINKGQAVIHFALDGTILDANANFLRSVGYDRAEVIGQHHRIFVEPAFARNELYATFWAGLRRGEFQAAEYKRIGKGGREIWLQATYNPIFDMNGKPFKIVKYATDVTDEKLRVADLTGQVAAINKSQGVIHFAMDGTILDANANFLAAIGYRLDEVRGQSHRMLVDPKYAETADYREFWNRLRQGEFKADIFQRIGKGGKNIWIQATYNPIFDMNGKPFKVVKYATDITSKMTSQIEAAMASEQTMLNVSTVASAAEELSASIGEISESLSRSRSVVDEIYDQAQTADQATNELKDAAASMSSVVELIRGVGAQINLLALNATIEAARAGAAGRGFAVVAGEVKNLSNQVTSATGRIAQDIQAMQGISGNVVGALGVIGRSIGSIRGIVTSVASAVEEQSAVTQEISSSMQIASNSVADVNRNLQALAS
ncbi:PAS domain S-box protein [Methylobacterium sp. BTF04]|nr:PAS domain S-box protein [Methylobacterium sp. BTF04]